MLLTENEVKTKEVLAWQGLHLLHNDLSSCSQKVRILMEELGIAYTSHPINLMKEEQRSEWYLGINSRGLVPVLVHDGNVHIESNDIIEYLNQNFTRSNHSMLPETESENDLMHAIMSLENQLHPDLRTVTFTYIAPDPGSHAQKTPRDNFDYIGRFHNACTTLNQRLENQQFLLGDRITLADITWFITLYRLSLAGYPLHHHPNLDAYFERIVKRPAFQNQVAQGPLLIRFALSIYRRINRALRNSLSRDYQRWEQLKTD